jgi:hypothetical protein
VRPNDKKGEHVGSPLHAVVQWFKTMTTNEYIVRDTDDYARIAGYKITRLFLLGIQSDTAMPPGVCQKIAPLVLNSYTIDLTRLVKMVLNNKNLYLCCPNGKYTITKDENSY